MCFARKLLSDKVRLRQGGVLPSKRFTGVHLESLGTGGVSGAAAVRPTSGAETIMAAINEP